MHAQRIAVRLSLSSAILLACVLSLTARSETITATAAVKNPAGTAASAPLTVEIQRYATDAERDELLDAVKKGGTSSARELLAKRDNVGTLKLGGRQVPIKYAYARTVGSGQLTTVITAEPIVHLGSGTPDAKPKAGYDLGLVLLDTTGSGPGTGELAPAAKVKVDDKGAIVTEDYGAEVVRLSNVVRK